MLKAPGRRMQFGLIYIMPLTAHVECRPSRLDNQIDVLSAQRQKCHILHSSFSLTKLSPVIPLILFS